ncbi:hypothetical protein [Hydrogenophaga sp.]|uniref:hypothetical protein n=1 Tax=Hydrogenophaga sp. TaxID=1904254 RepID=UPI003D2C37E7
MVDRALGREPSTPGTQSDTAPDLSQVAATPQDNPPVDVVAYDDRGNSSFAPLDPGSHFSQRV